VVSGLRSRLTDKRVVICAGAGVVGKATMSAAVALGLAALERLALALNDSEPICLMNHEADAHDVDALPDLCRELFGAPSAQIGDPSAVVERLATDLG
jgi:hypothetical protein